MKIAVVTLHRLYNYGSVLQSYATQRIFEQEGHQVKIIDYVTTQRTLRRLLRGVPDASFRGAKLLVYRCMKVASIMLKELTFGRFVRRNLHLTKKYISAEDLDRDPPVADLYVTGSDQTWNSVYNEGVDRGFFLDFLPENARRISFAASFGKTELEAAEIPETKRYISRYEGLSVRENSAKDILAGLGREDAVQIIDPTLQIRKEDWLQIASKRLIKPHYLILMLLYNEDNHATEYARKLADEKGLVLVKLSWELMKPRMVDVLMTHRSPADFLSLFYHADFVVTNSFHGVAFSINLEKQFIVVPRNEFNSRIDSLLALTGLQRRLVSDEKQLTVAREQIDYIPVQKCLQIERERANEYIRRYVK